MKTGIESIAAATGGTAVAALSKSTKEQLLGVVKKLAPAKPGRTWVISESASGSQLVQRDDKTGGETVVTSASFKGKEFEIWLRAFINGLEVAKRGL